MRWWGAKVGFVEWSRLSSSRFEWPVLGENEKFEGLGRVGYSLDVTMAGRYGSLSAYGIEMSETPNESALLQYLRMTEKRPGMYFGSYSVDHVKRHLDGWRAHRIIHMDEDAFADFFFEDFHSFVESYYQDNRTVGWNGLIRENTETEKEGFRMFMSLLEQFATTFAPAGN